MPLAMFWQLFLGAILVAALKPTPTSKSAKRSNNTPLAQFVTTQDGQFMVNGSTFRFIGTNACWLHALNTEGDIDNTLSNMAAANVTVVRTWAFNDVEAIPENGTWFQLISNGTLTINNGTNGLQKLDKVVELAQKHGIYVLLSLTNNWNPLALLDNDTNPSVPLGALRRDVTPGTNNTLPRNSLSNDYGGMDVYVRQFGNIHQHDQFYIDETIINAFKNYTTQIVSRYVNSTSVFGWELANDPRCNSSLPAPDCQPTTVTQWHSTLAQHVRSIDPNHLISSGNQGFFCVGCPKLFPRAASLLPQASPVPSETRRRRLPEPPSKAIVLKGLWEARRKARGIKNKASQVSGGVRIRGHWFSPGARHREELVLGPGLDGSHGVDSEDILNIPEIGFGSFQLFPDQNTYATPDDASLPAFNNTILVGLDWIKRHADTARVFGKPVSLTAFGLVTQNNSQAFVPFPMSFSPFALEQGSPQEPTQKSFGVTDEQLHVAYSTWLSAGISDGLQGMLQYQWGSGNLTTHAGTLVTDPNTEAEIAADGDITGISPNDGYSIQGISKEDVLFSIQEAAQQVSPDI